MLRNLRDPAEKPPADGKKNGPRTGKTAAKRRTRVAEGVYKDRYGLAATVKVNGIQREIRFPAGTSLKTIRARRDELKASLRRQPHGKRHTLAYDAERYLKQVEDKLVSIGDRQHHIRLWVARFGHLPTLALPQPQHISALNDQLHQWRETLSASACNHRRNALTNLVRVLYGRRTAAELIDLARFEQPAPKPRWIQRSHIADVLAQLTPGSRTAARLRLMHWTGMRPSQMGRLQPEDFRLDEHTPYVVVPRGKKGRLAAIPLIREGLEAARDFMAVGAYGQWSCASANKALKRAADKTGHAPFTVYQIRHSFATGLRRAGTDVADIQDLYGHTNPETTMIYAPPQLDKHAEALERLHHADHGKQRPQYTIRLAQSAGTES